MGNRKGRGRKPSTVVIASETLATAGSRKELWSISVNSRQGGWAFLLLYLSVTSLGSFSRQVCVAALPTETGDNHD